MGVARDARRHGRGMCGGIAIDLIAIIPLERRSRNVVAGTSSDKRLSVYWRTTFRIRFCIGELAWSAFESSSSGTRIPTGDDTGLFVIRTVAVFHLWTWRLPVVGFF